MHNVLSPLWIFPMEASFEAAKKFALLNSQMLLAAKSTDASPSLY